MGFSLPDAAVPFLADLALKSTLVMLVVAVAVWDSRRASAARRHLLLSLGLAALLALPVLGHILPAWNFPVTSPWVDKHLSQPRQPIVSVRRLPLPVGAPVTALRDLPAGPPVLVASREPGPAQTLPIMPPVMAVTQAVVRPEPAAVPWLLYAWLLGAGLGLVWITLGFLSLWRLGRLCRPVPEGLLTDLARQLAQDLGIRRRFVLRQTCARSMPMTWGLLRPVILLPETALSWPVERQQAVLLHELAHVRRWDCLTQFVGQLARTLFWFQPLAWWALARLRTEQENACDDLVLGEGVSAPNYSEHLLAVTANLTPGFAVSSLGLAMARATRLRRRLQAVLDSARDRRPLPGGAVLLGVITTFALTGLCATMMFESRPVRAEEGKAVVRPPLPILVQALDPSLKRIAEIEAKLKENYVKEVDAKSLADSAVRGMLQGLKDPYTDYLPPPELGAVKRQLRGAMTGIGAQLKMVDERVTVMTPLEGSPALKAGLRPGDIIEAIDGKTTRGLTLAQAVELILGPKDTDVKLKIVHSDGVVKDLTITRRELRIPSLGGFSRAADGSWLYVLDPRHHIGYVRIYQFSSNTAAELASILQGLQKDGLKGLILDLRFCPGGFLEQAVEACKLFIAEGTIVSTRRPGKEEHVFKADGKASFGETPLVVVVNEQTASAAEIVTGALRDHKRAVVVGTRTFGKGSVQAILKLDSGGALRVTTAYHYLPSGRNIQKRPGKKDWGVDPSDGFYVPVPPTQAEALTKNLQERMILSTKRQDPVRITPNMLAERYADPQLAAALRTLVARITGGEFVKTGKPLDVQQEQIQRLEELRERRAALVRSLQKLDRDLQDLQSTGGGKE